MRAPSIKDETQVARELEAKAADHERTYLPLGNAIQSVQNEWEELQHSIKGILDQFEHARGENGKLRGALFRLRKSNARLQKAHALTVRHLTPQARMLVRSLSPDMMDTVRLLLGRVSEEDLRALVAGTARVQHNDPPAPAICGSRWRRP